MYNQKLVDKNLEYCAYTYRHRKAIEYLVNKLIKDERTKTEMLKRAKMHDIDKLMMYLFLEKKEASRIHKQIASHHMQNDILKTKYDKLEAVLDYESAGYTKPDKPLNAYDTIEKFRKKEKFSNELCDELIGICKEYGLATSYSVTKDKEGMEYLSQYDIVTPEMIYADIIEYFQLMSKQNTKKNIL